MTSGVPLYLVSACGTAEEFVAAFRRYADRTGLFVPAASPLPAGRRGRLAVTLKDGSVMIEGEAEILQSSAKPTVLHGRPGMTVKFIEPDEFSKIVIGELEKARLAMKVPTPSVPPRPANVPAQPRPVVPPIAGRIDAANALAECVVIGDASVLQNTATMPRATNDPGSAGIKARPSSTNDPGSAGIKATPSSTNDPGSAGIKATPSSTNDPGSAGNKAKFVVPSIPTAPGRPKTPSVPPSIAAAPERPKTPSVPPAIPAAPGRPRTPSVPPSIAPFPAKVEPTREQFGVPGKTANPKLTSIGFPAVDKVPAQVEPGKVSNATTLGMPAITREPSVPMKAPENPMLQTQHGVSGTAMRAPAPTPPKPTPQVETDDEATTIGESPPKAAAAPAPVPERTAHPKSHKATSIGFPAVRSPFETQPVGVVPPPTPAKPGDPAPPIVAKAKPGQPGPRGKNPTTPPLTPRHPTPVAPLPIVRPPAKSARVADEEEKTDLSGIPQPADPQASTAESGRAYADKSGAAKKPVDPHGNTQITPSGRSGGMRASEIMAAIPTEDWTMTPDASAPTVLPSAVEPQDPNDVSEPTPAPGPVPKGPPTGDWTIQLDPEAGWSEPEKVAKAAADAAAAAANEPTKTAKRAKTPAAGAAAAKSGNPDMAIASKEAFTAVEWEEKPTGIGEAKIEIDSTLMEPLRPMPALDDEDPAALMKPLGKVGASTGSQSIPGSLGSGPQRIPTKPEVIPPPLAPMPPVGPSTGVTAAQLMTPSAMMPATAPPDAFAGFGQMGFPQPSASTHDLGAKGSAPTKKRQMLIVASAAVAVVIIGLIVVLMLSGHKTKQSSAATSKGSAQVSKGSAQVAPDKGSAAVVPAGSGSADEVAVGSGSAEPAVQVPVVVDAGVARTEIVPAPGGTCQVAVTSVPSGADVIFDKNKLGVTPGTFDLPCGVASTLTLKKAKYINTAKSVTPSAGAAPTKLAVRLGKPMFSLKVTSTPAGATITAGGKSAGVTPATIRIAGFEATTIMLTKPGYAADSEKVTAKSNGQALHVVLKKGGRR